VIPIRRNIAKVTPWDQLFGSGGAQRYVDGLGCFFGLIQRAKS